MVKRSRRDDLRNSSLQMKVLTAITTAAVLSITTAGTVPAQAISMGSCISRSAKAISKANHGSWSRWIDYKIEAQTICHYSVKSGGLGRNDLEFGIQKAGLSGKISSADVLGATVSRRPTRSASRKTYSGYSRPTYNPAQRNYQARSNSSSSRCPAGTRYHKIKTSGLIFKRTVAEGCFTDYEAAQLKVNADSANRLRHQQFQNNLRNNRMRQCFGSANVYGNTVYGNSTCF